MCDAHSKADDAGGFGLNWDAANDGLAASGSSDSGIEAANHFAEVAVASPTLAAALVLLAICVVVVAITRGDD